MTCEYSDIDPFDALYKAARRYPGGVEALARRMETPTEVLRSKLRRQVTTHRLTLDEFSEALEYLEEARVDGWATSLRALCWRHAHIGVELPSNRELDNQQLVALVCKVFKEQGDVADRISRMDLKDIEKEFEEAFVAMAILHDRIRRKAGAA